MHVDPTLSFGVDVSHDYRSDGYVCDNCGLRIGNSMYNGDSYNRAIFHFDISPLWGKTVVGAQMNVNQDAVVHRVHPDLGRQPVPGIGVQLQRHRRLHG